MKISEQRYDFPLTQLGCGKRLAYRWIASNLRDGTLERHFNYPEFFDYPCGMYLANAFEYLCWDCAIKAGWIW